MNKIKRVGHAARMYLACSIVALHEFGHPEAAGWVAAIFAMIALFYLLMAPVEPAMLRAMARWHAESDD